MADAKIRSPVSCLSQLPTYVLLPSCCFNITVSMSLKTSPFAVLVPKIALSDRASYLNPQQASHEQTVSVVHSPLKVVRHVTVQCAVQHGQLVLQQHAHPPDDYISLPTTHQASTSNAYVCLNYDVPGSHIKCTHFSPKGPSLAVIFAS